MYKVQKQDLVITTNRTLTDQIYGGWLAVNTGNVNVKVDGYTLQPGDGLDYTHLQPDVIWMSPIKITVPTGGEVTVTRLLYKEDKTNTKTR